MWRIDYFGLCCSLYTTLQGVPILLLVRYKHYSTIGVPVRIARTLEPLSLNTRSVIKPPWVISTVLHCAGRKTGAETVRHTSVETKVFTGTGLRMLDETWRLRPLLQITIPLSSVSGSCTGQRLLELNNRQRILLYKLETHRNLPAMRRQVL